MSDCMWRRATRAVLRLQKSESLASSARQVASGSPAASSLAPAVEVTPRVPRAPPTATDMVTVPSGEYQQLLDDMRKMKVIIKGHEKRIKLLEDQVKHLEADLYTEGEAPPPTGAPPDPSGAALTDATDASNGHAHRGAAVSAARHYVSAHAAAHSGSGSGSQTSSKHASATQSPTTGQSPAPIISGNSDDPVHL